MRTPPHRTGLGVDSRGREEMNLLLWVQLLHSTPDLMQFPSQYHILGHGQGGENSEGWQVYVTMTFHDKVSEVPTI